jgi:hypothetical protein
MNFRFTQYEIHGQEVVIEAATEQEARALIAEGEGVAVGDTFYVRTADDIPLELMEQD